jgi:hypothetical protein
LKRHRIPSAMSSDLSAEQNIPESESASSSWFFFAAFHDNGTTTNFCWLTQNFGRIVSILSISISKSIYAMDEFEI